MSKHLVMTPLAFRSPRPQDAAAIWRMVQQRGGGQHDSCYAYLLLCAHFADTSVVAARGEQLVGFALGYRLPLRPQEAFVSQLGVASDQQNAELAPRLLEELLARRACIDARFLCMTCGPHDASLRTVFQQVARRRGVRCAVEPCFPAALFAEPHADEHLLRLGPLES